MDFFDLVLKKKYEDAYKIANAEYTNDPNETNLRNRGDASLCLKHYGNALEDYLKVIQVTEGRADADFIRAGVSYWLIGNHTEAIDIWKKGLTTKYTDAAGGVEIPATLYFAAISQKNESLEKEAIKLLKKRWKSKAVVNWPGAIAGYLLDEVSADECIKAIGSDSLLSVRYLCQLYFYIAVKCLKAGDRVEYLNYLSRCAFSEMGYLEQEYYLAIGELDTINGK
ncbi:hypothetical protein [Paenibacillus sp. H1-7]|uniref:hypothetical protein n=1 Tax=Paenibacillus sp. H1-7 TaxID=2282849 RepID=UPI001EF7AFF7|nr:hypothetical protein [Paenibacillus sp. H1-7]